MAASSEQHDAAKRSPRRLGMIANDPLRIVGLQAILDQPIDGDRTPIEVVALSGPRVLHTAGLSIVFIDSAATTHLLDLLSVFRRARPDLPLIILGGEASLEYIETVIAAGAKGFLSYTAKEEELRMAIAVVDDGSVWAPRKVMARLVASSSRVQQPGNVPPLDLTSRETEVLQLLIQGQSNREIAETLGIDGSTVKAHLGRLMRKVGVTNRTALTMQALRYSSIPEQRPDTLTLTRR